MAKIFRDKSMDYELTLIPNYDKKIPSVDYCYWLKSLEIDSLNQPIKILLKYLQFLNQFIKLWVPS